MKPASPEFYERLATDVTTLCRLWRLEPKNGLVFHMTDHDTPIVFEDVEYLPTKSFESSAINNSIGGSNVNFDIKVLLDDDVTRADMERGMYDGARMQIDAIFYDHPELGVMQLAKGFVTDISIPASTLAVLSCAGRVTNTRRGLTEQYSPMCRADFCDARCKLDIGLFSTSFSVISVAGILGFGSSLGDDYAEDYWSFGTVSWVSGRNAGARTEVYRSNEDGNVKLLVRTPYPIEVGDEGSISRGCDKRLTTCQGYGNQLNFRGEPFVPGADMMNAPVFSIPPPNASIDLTPIPDDGQSDG